MAYKLLGMAVWRGLKLVLRRRYGHLIPSRRVAIGALVLTTVVGLALAQRREAN
jgi:hypothetical protein